MTSINMAWPTFGIDFFNSFPDIAIQRAAMYGYDVQNADEFLGAVEDSLSVRGVDDTLPMFDATSAKSFGEGVTAGQWIGAAGTVLGTVGSLFGDGGGGGATAPPQQPPNQPTQQNPVANPNIPGYTGYNTPGNPGNSLPSWFWPVIGGVGILLVLFIILSNKGGKK